MTDTDFEGRIGLITGGASGIGAATARRIQAGGGRVAIFDLDPARVAAATAELGNGAIGIPGDVTRSAELNAAVARVESELGGLDVLVCSAGIAGASLRTNDVDDDEWRRVMAVNADGVFFANRAALPGMTSRGYGRIVNLASVAGNDVATTGVLVNCVTPAPVETPMVVGLSQEHLDYMLSRVPMGRLAKTEEAAELIAFLASDRMTFSTGAAFDLSGGRLTY
jgi:3-oxoacyl-[acyl-carrier protein] reductase